MTDSAKDIAKAIVGEALESFVNHRFDMCIKLLSNAIDLDPLSRRAFLSRGAAYLRLQQNQEAINDFNRVIALDGKLARAYHLRGLAYNQAGDHSHALKDFKRAIELDPEYSAAYRIGASRHVTRRRASQLKKDDSSG